MKPLVRFTIPLFCALVVLLGIIGCGTTGGQKQAAAESGEDSTDAETPVVARNSDEIRVGDMLNISFRGTVTMAVLDHQERVSENGFIALPQIGEIKAQGKNRVALQKEIQAKYVPKYYKNLTVIIAPDERFFYVYGEVNKPDRHFYAGELTVLGAISAAGDFTDFANHKKVKLLRTDGTVETINCKDALENPSKYDVEVLPGDTINVPRRIF